ncbi:MAG: helix-turn-helix transcriptional regulator [Thermoleophilia bacterium]|nr:helix-turn-helix transcriptional regulator [Thermoleophilia bacterium]
MASRSPDHVALGKAVREIRLAKGFSQEQLALESGLDRTYVGGVERGERNPSYGSLLKLAKALGISPSEILALGERR